MIGKNTYINPTAIIDEGCHIGDECKIWHFSHIVKGSIIGNNCSIGQNVVIMPGATLGDGCKVQNNVSLYSGVHCESDVFIGPSVVFTNVINPRAFIERKNEYKKTIIHQGASIGANATIVCGVEIGAYAMIGAGSVVSKSILSYALVVGNPSRQIGWVSRAGYRLQKKAAHLWQCPQSFEVYEEIAGQLFLKSPLS